MEAVASISGRYCMNAALWLLDRCGVSQALAGDLAEERHSGRSIMWLGWQAVMAIVLASGTAVRHHTLLAVRALLTGVVVSELLRRFVTVPILHVTAQTLVGYGLRSAGVWFIFSPYVATPVLKLARTAATGWVIGHLHRPYSVPMVMAAASAIALWNGPETFTATYRHVVGVAGNTRFLPYLCMDVGNVLASATGFAVGALIGGKPRLHPLNG
jgi:hypothetical protein